MVIRLPRPHPGVGPAALVLAFVVSLSGATMPAVGQDVDAYVVPRGLVRVSFEPHYTSYDRRFALGSSTIADGDLEFIGADLTVDSAGTNILPALQATEQAIRDLTGNSDYRMNLGRFRTVRDADIRRFPFNLAVGLTGRITFTASVPLVTHRMQVTFDIDSTEANVGWNQGLSVIATPGNDAQLASLLAQLDASIAEVENAIAAGGFGCPGTTECMQATASLDRARALRLHLAVFSADAPGTPTAFAPLAGSAAGTAIIAEIAAVAAELEMLGATPVTATLPLPTEAIGEEAFNGTFLPSPDLGYDAFPLDFVRGTGLGDAEVGLRIGIIQSSAIRTVVRFTVRLPTGTIDRPDHYLDLPTGDGQVDVEGGFEAALAASARLGLSLAGSYTRQFSDQIERRVGPPDTPLLPAATTALVNRHLGDMLWLSAYPTLRLTPEFRVFGSVAYFRKAADTYTLAGSGPALSLFPVSSLGNESRQESLSFGAGIAYRSGWSATDRRLPVEAGLNYQSTFSGSGGLTPKASQIRLYLRLYRNLFAPKPASPEPEVSADSGSSARQSPAP